MAKGKAKADGLLQTMLRLGTGTDIREKPNTDIKYGDPELDALYKALGSVPTFDLSKVREKAYLESIRVPDSRFDNYDLYDEMDDPGNVFVSSALDMLAEDVTQIDTRMKRNIWVESDNEEIKRELDKFIGEMGIAGKLPQWVRLMAKYGDFTPIIHGKSGEGVTNIKDTIHPGRFMRITNEAEMNKNLIGFSADERVLPPWALVHFKLPGTQVEDDLKVGNQGHEIFTTMAKKPKRINTDYGQSILYPVRQVFKQLQIAEDALILTRLTNGIRRYLFKIAVTGQDKAQQVEQINYYKQLIKREIGLDIDTGKLQSRGRIPTFMEEMFIPVTNEKDVVVEPMGGDINIKEAFDIDYLKSKFFAGIRIPQAFMSFTESLNSRSTLMQLDIRYARTVGALQTALKVGLYRMFRIHLAYLGKFDDIEFDINMSSVSTIEEETTQEIIQRKIQTARDTLDVMTQLEEGYAAKLAAAKAKVQGEEPPEDDGGGFGGFGFEGRVTEGAKEEPKVDLSKDDSVLFDRKFFMHWFAKEVLQLSETEVLNMMNFKMKPKKPRKRVSSMVEMAGLSSDLMLPLPHVKNLNEWEKVRKNVVTKSLDETVDGQKKDK